MKNENDYYGTEDDHAISYLEFGSIDPREKTKKYGDIGRIRKRMICICLLDTQEIFFLSDIFYLMRKKI